MGVISNMSVGQGNINSGDTTIESITILDGKGERRIIYLNDDARVFTDDRSILKAIKIAKTGKFT